VAAAYTENTVGCFFFPDFAVNVSETLSEKNGNIDRSMVVISAVASSNFKTSPQFTAKFSSTIPS